MNIENGCSVSLDFSGVKQFAQCVVPSSKQDPAQILCALSKVANVDGTTLHKIPRTFAKVASGEGTILHKLPRVFSRVDSAGSTILQKIPSAVSRVTSAGGHDHAQHLTCQF